MTEALALLAFYTIGYGGRDPSSFISILQQYGIKTLVDVRMRPNRACMGCYVKAKSPDKGIERLLAGAGIRYLSLPQLGNPFLADPDWKERYRRHVQTQGIELFADLGQVEHPFCLMCAEKQVTDCHRLALSELLVKHGWKVTHIE